MGHLSRLVPFRPHYDENQFPPTGQQIYPDTRERSMHIFEASDPLAHKQGLLSDELGERYLDALKDEHGLYISELLFETVKQSFR